MQKGSPSPWPWTSTRPQPVRNQATRWKVSRGAQAQLPLYLQPLPITHVGSTSWQITVALDSLRSAKPTVTVHGRHPGWHSLWDSNAWWPEVGLSWWCQCKGAGVTGSRTPKMAPSSCRKTSSGLPLILHYGELQKCFILYYTVIVTEIKCTINITHWNHPESTPPPVCGNNCLP